MFRIPASSLEERISLYDLFQIVIRVSELVKAPEQVKITAIELVDAAEDHGLTAVGALRIKSFIEFQDAD